jgi:hypothetical protein
MIKIIAIILFFVSSAYAQTSETQYVDWSTGCGGNDGTIGNPYCSCSEWEGQNRNLVAENVNLTVEFTGTGTGGVLCNINGWTTDATRRIKLNNLHILSNAYHGGLRINNSYVTVSDFSIKKNGGGATLLLDAPGFGGETDITLERGIFEITVNSTGWEGQYFVRVNPACNLRNIIFINNSSKPTLSNSTGPGKTWNFENLTIIGGTFGFDSSVNSTPTGSTLTIRNLLIQNATTADYNVSFHTGTLVTATNLTSDNTSPQAGLRNKTLTFVDAAAKNYRLASTDTDAIDAGTTIGSFSDDLDGTTRPQGSAWDIGAHEYISASTPTFPVFQAIGAL